MRLHYIYKISFPLEMSSKVYIGKTINPENRFRGHKNESKNNSKYAIHRAIRKYGIKNIIFEVIATCLYNTDICANEAEISIIEQYDSFKNGYNMTIGGDGTGSGKNHPNFGKHLSKETKKKLSIAKLGEKCYLFGKHHSIETKKKMSIAQLGKTQSEKHKRKMSIIYKLRKNNKDFSFKGKRHTEESKKKMSIANSGENNYLWGKPLPKETKRKISIKFSKKWKIYHSNGEVSIVNRLKLWCRENNYSSSAISRVFTGKRKFHKDIIKVEQL